MAVRQSQHVLCTVYAVVLFSPSVLCIDFSCLTLASITWLFACRSLVSDMVFGSSSTRINGGAEQHYWEVEITNTAECNIMVGVCRPDAKVGENGAWTTSKGWCYFARDGKAYHHEEPKTIGTYNNPAQSGDRIGIMLNEEVR